MQYREATRKREIFLSGEAKSAEIPELYFEHFQRSMAGKYPFSGCRIPTLHALHGSVFFKPSVILRSVCGEESREQNNQCNHTGSFADAQDNDGDLPAQWDLPDSVPSELVGKVAMEIILRMFKIIDDAYPEVIKAVWA